MENTGGAVTLEAFADRVGCHFTTASRLRNGQRMPGRELLGRIVEEFDLDPQETLRIFTREDPEEFGEYLRANVFTTSEEDEGGDSDSSSTPDAA